MKKQYIAPANQITYVQAQNAICGMSNGVQTNDNPTVVDGGDAPKRIGGLYI